MTNTPINLERRLSRATSKIRILTQDNLHVEAVIEIAKYAAYKHHNLKGVMQIVDRAKAIQTLYKMFGYMPPELNMIRDVVRGKALSLLNDFEKEKINMVI